MWWISQLCSTIPPLERRRRPSRTPPQAGRGARSRSSHSLAASGDPAGVAVIASGTLATWGGGWPPTRADRTTSGPSGPPERGDIQPRNHGLVYLGIHGVSGQQRLRGGTNAGGHGTGRASDELYALLPILGAPGRKAALATGETPFRSDRLPRKTPTRRPPVRLIDKYLSWMSPVSPGFSVSHL